MLRAGLSGRPARGLNVTGVALSSFGCTWPCYFLGPGPAPRCLPERGGGGSRASCILLKMGNLWSTSATARVRSTSVWGQQSISGRRWLSMSSLPESCASRSETVCCRPTNSCRARRISSRPTRSPGGQQQGCEDAARGRPGTAGAWQGDLRLAPRVATRWRGGHRPEPAWTNRLADAGGMRVVSPCARAGFSCGAARSRPRG